MKRDDFSNSGSEPIRAHSIRMTKLGPDGGPTGESVSFPALEADVAPAALPDGVIEVHRDYANPASPLVGWIYPVANGRWCCLTVDGSLRPGSYKPREHAVRALRAAYSAGDM